MNSGWPSQRFSEARRSTAATTAASKPTPVWKQKNRPLTWPSPIGRKSPASIPAASRSTAATGSLGSPIVRANTFVEPPGSTPSAVSVPAMPVATSFSVPSPPKPTTTSSAAAGGVVRRTGWRGRAGSSRPARRRGRGSAGGARRRCCGPSPTRRTSSRRAGCARRRTVLSVTTVDAVGVRTRTPSVTMAPMNVIVCVKQIPDPAQPGELDPSDNTLKRDGKLILDESDSYGVEMALQLVGNGRRRRGQPGVDGAERRDLRAAHGAGDGRGEGRARVRPRAGRFRRADDGQGPRRGGASASATPT